MIFIHTRFGAIAQLGTTPTRPAARPHVRR